MGTNELKLPQKNMYPKRPQISCPIDSNLFDRFNEYTKRFGHGSKKMFVETAIKKLLDEVERN